MAHEYAPAETPNYDELKLTGYLAEFEKVDDLVHACRKVRDAGYSKWDAHTPFPVHGIEDSMGIKMTILPWIVLGGGLAGLATAILLQWWCNAVDYPFLVSGKPYWSIPASVPIYFELTVLLASITAFLSVLGLNWLPAFYHPLFRSERFKRATDDRFFIAIDETDPLFHKKRTKELLEGLSSLPVEDVMDHVVHPPFPKAILYAGVLVVCATFIPLALAVRARYSTTTTPRIHLVWDMDYQPKFKAQRSISTALFADGRATRPQVAGTVAVADAVEEEELRFLTGIKGVGPDGKKAFVTDFPFAADEMAAAMARGHDRFAIFCTPCHGLAGDGLGIVNQRALVLKQGKWVQAKSFHDDAIRNKPVGEIFDNVTNGINTMPAYRGQISARDRWSIVLYVRALQKSQWAEQQDVPPEELKRIAMAK